MSNAIVKASCVVIGGGPAALQAALFLGRASVATRVIGLPDRSDLAYGRVIGNYFGLAEDMPGKALLENGVLQVKKYNIEVVPEEVVDLVRSEENVFRTVTETGKEYLSDTVLVATGQAHTRAGIRGEEKFLGRGVHTCVACDGIFFKDKRVAVIGSGSHALQEAIELTTYTPSITVYTQGDQPQWSRELLAAAKSKGIAMSEKRMKALGGETVVHTAVFADNSEESLDGIFVALGSASSITFAYKLGLDLKDGFLVIDRDGKTSVPGVWAAGGATGGNAQIAKSVGEGCNAALSIIRTTKGLAEYLDQT